MGTVWPSLRRDCRSGATDWANLGGAVRICAGLSLAADWGSAVRLRAGFHRHGRFGAAPRAIGGGCSPHGDQSIRRPGSDDRGSLYSSGHTGRAWHRSGECALQQPVGRVHHRNDHPHRSHHGMVDVQKPCGKDRGHRAQHFRSRFFNRERGGWTLGCAIGMGRGVNFHSSSDHDSHGHLRVSGVGTSSVAGAGTARLSFYLCKAGHHRGTGHRRVRGSSQHSISEFHALRAWWRTDHQGHFVSVPFCDHCLWRDFGISLAGVFGHHTQDAG